MASAFAVKVKIFDLNSSGAEQNKPACADKPECQDTVNNSAYFARVVNYTCKSL